jgi:hypothetical protein
MQAAYEAQRAEAQRLLEEADRQAERLEEARLEAEREVERQNLARLAERERAAKEALDALRARREAAEEREAMRRPEGRALAPRAASVPAGPERARAGRDYPYRPFPQGPPAVADETLEQALERIMDTDRLEEEIASQMSEAESLQGEAKKLAKAVVQRRRNAVKEVKDTARVIRNKLKQRRATPGWYATVVTPKIVRGEGYLRDLPDETERQRLVEALQFMEDLRAQKTGDTRRRITHPEDALRTETAVEVKDEPEEEAVVVREPASTASSSGLFAQPSAFRMVGPAAEAAQAPAMHPAFVAAREAAEASRAAARAAVEAIPLMDAPLAAPEVPEIQPSATASSSSGLAPELAALLDEGSREPIPLQDRDDNDDPNAVADPAVVALEEDPIDYAEIDTRTGRVGNQAYLHKDQLSNIQFVPRVQALLDNYTPAGQGRSNAAKVANLRRLFAANFLHHFVKYPQKPIAVNRSEKPYKWFYGTVHPKSWGFDVDLQTAKDAAAYVFETIGPEMLRTFRQQRPTMEELQALGYGRISDEQVEQGWVRSRRAQEAGTPRRRR